MDDSRSKDSGCWTGRCKPYYREPEDRGRDRDLITFLSLIFSGFFLGMRHTIDLDHVIAVTTIVSRSRTVWPAARIGALPHA